MCGRFALAADDASLDAEFGSRRWPEREPRYNIAATQAVMVVKMAQAYPHWLRWGLVPRWARDSSGAARMINARSETLLEKPAFRNLTRHNRCLVPATGYYEWQTAPSGGKQPFHFRRADARPFAFAALWDSWEGAGGELLETCSILTMDAPDWMRAWHHRCPVMLRGGLIESWLDETVGLRESLAQFLIPWDRNDAEVHPVSTRVNSVAHDDPECVLALGNQNRDGTTLGRPIQRDLFG